MLNIEKFYISFACFFLMSLLTACASQSTVAAPPSGPVAHDALFSNSILFPSSAAAHFYWPPTQSLTKDIRAVGGEIYQSGDFITIVLPADALFEPSTSVLLSKAYALIEETAQVLVRFPNEDVIITAHTDGIGSGLYQAKLSREQAQLFALALWQQDRIDLKMFQHFKYAGMGNTRPITEDLSPHGQALNRRIQITIYPSKEMEEMKQLLGEQEIEQI